MAMKFGKSASAVAPVGQEDVAETCTVTAFAFIPDAPIQVPHTRTGASLFSSGGSAADAAAAAAPPVVVPIRPELPRLSTWARNPAKALYKFITFFFKLALYPMYKERTEVLERYFTEPDSEEAQAVAKDIKEGVMKEQETVGLVGALLLSIAANVVFTVPDTILSITGQLAPLRDLYMVCSTAAFGAEATATCLSVLLILQLNAQHSQHAYRSLVGFLRSFWPLCGLTSILAATGLMGLSGTVVLYCCAGYIAGSLTLAVPILVGVATVSAYVLAAMIMGKMLMTALQSSKETGLL